MVNPKPSNTTNPDTIGGWKDAFSSLRSRDFRFLWLGSLSVFAGYQMAAVARGYLTYDMTSSPLLLGVVSVGYAFPMLMLSLFGGALADRFRKRRIIQVCQILIAAISIFIAVSITTETITWIHLLFASITNGIVFAFMVPSRTALIPQLVGTKTVTNALALNSAAMSTMTMLAPAIAGNLYNWIGPGGLYYIVAGVQLFAALMTGQIRKKESRPQKTGRAVLGSIADGFRYLRGKRVVIVLLIMGLSVALFALPLIHLLPIFVKDVYKGGPETLGLLVSLAGLGAIAGALGVAVLGKRHRGIVLIVGGLIGGAALITIASVPLIWAGAIALTLLGLGNSIRRSLNMAMILELVDEEYRGRVSSIYVMNFGLMPLGVLPASAVAQYFGPQTAAWVLGGLLLAIVLAILLTQKPLRRMM